MNGAFLINDVRVETRLNRIHASGGVVQVEPKIMQVLVCLARSPGEVVSKDALIEAVWPRTSATDDVLARAISELRKAFGDDSKSPRVIETIRKGGYRLLAPVSPIDAEVRKSRKALVACRDVGARRCHHRVFLARTARRQSAKPYRDNSVDQLQGNRARSCALSQRFTGCFLLERSRSGQLGHLYCASGRRNAAATHPKRTGGWQSSLVA